MVGSNFTRIRSTTRSTMAKATAVRVSTGKKFSQLLIITPAVAIDSNEHDDYHGPFNSSSLDSGCGGSSEGSLSDDLLEEDEQRRQRRRQQGAGDRRNNNDTMHQLPPLLGGGGGGRRDGGGATSSQGSWRWCGLICSAVKCFRAAAATTASRRSQQGRPSPRQPLAGTAVRYTTTLEGVWGQDGGGGGGSTGRRQGTTRFSNNHVYEYTIKSYHHPQRGERRSNGGGLASVALQGTGGAGSRSASLSSDTSALSMLAETGTLADHDHINNNHNNSAGHHNGNILANSSIGTIAGGSSSGIGTTSIVVTTATTSSGASSPTIETSTIGRVSERNNIMYKL